MENEFNFYNWGYGMCVAINDGLPNAIPSAEMFANMLNCRRSGFFGQSSDYTKITNLFDGNASFDNVVMGIIDLSKKTQAGDIVSIYFGLHGTSELRKDKSGTSENRLYLSSGSLTEGELSLLLKLFKPEVRVILIMDICQSGTWIDKHNFVECQEYEAYQVLKKHADKFGSLALRYTIRDLYSYFMESKLQATVTVIGTISDYINVNDTLCFSFYLNEFWRSKGHLNFTMEILVRRLREKAYLLIPNVDPDLEMTVIGGKTLWHLYYATYSTWVLGCPMLKEDAPVFDSQNQHHQEAMLHFLPTVNFIGPNHEKFFDRNAFCVN